MNYVAIRIISNILNPNYHNPILISYVIFQLSAFGTILRGDPRRTLPHFMKESGADLLVMGARGLGPLKR